MVRQNRLIEKSTTWEHQVLPIQDPAALDVMWQEWAVHECIKRYLLVSSERSGISILTHERSTAWFAWHIATIKLILFTFRRRRCFRQTNLL